MSFRNRVAAIMRSVGLSGLVDTPAFRKMAGAQMYKRHLNAKEEDNSIESSEEDSSRVVKRTETSPLVSVIVPAYNVEKYLAAAVDTIRKQTYSILEIIIVNDGSTDNTGKIADSIAARDSRVTAVHKPNGGLGAARNTGLQIAKGQYVAFVDSDDELTPMAIEVMLESLESTASDFAIGAIERYTSATTWTPFWVDLVHHSKRNSVRGNEFPEVLWDNIVCNKLFRRSAWDKYVGFFPEGVLYEDQECTAKLYSSSATFDILTDITYRWYKRDDASSISQQKHTVADLESRIYVAETVQQIFIDSGDFGLQDYYAQKILGDDFYTYCQQVPRAEEAFYDLLRVGVARFITRVSENALLNIPFDRRNVILSLVRQDKNVFYETMMQFVDWGKSWVTSLSEDNILVGSLPNRDTSYLSINETRILPSTLSVKSEISRQFLSEEGEVVFEGFSFVESIGDDSQVKRKIQLVRTGESGEPTEAIDLEHEGTVSQWADLVAADAYNSHLKSGFRFTINAATVDAIVGDVDPAIAAERWTLSITHRLGGYVWKTTSIAMRENGSAGDLSPTKLTDGGRRIAFEHRKGRLEAIPLRPRFRAITAKISEGGLELSFSASTLSALKRLSSRENLAVELRLNGALVARSECDWAGAEWNTRVDLNDWEGPVKQNSRVADIQVVSRDGYLRAPIAVECREDIILDTSFYAVDSSTYGYLQVRELNQFAVVEEVTISADGSKVLCSGKCVFDPSMVRQMSPSFALVGRSTNIFPSRMVWDGKSNKYSVEFDLFKQDLDGKPVMYPSQDYIFEVLQATGRKLPASVWVTCARSLAKRFPVEERVGQTRLRLSRKHNQGGLGIAIVRPISRVALSKFSQHAYARAYFAEGRNVEERAILFESFGGRTVSDAPKALDREIARRFPDVKRYWSVRDRSVAVPDGAQAVIMYSEEWFRTLSRTKIIVNNNNFPHFFRKHEDQIYLQTWHGTPLKKIGNDVPAQNLSLSYRELMKREAGEYWDYLIAQSPWASRILKSAFGYEGEVLDVGYPRNDALFGVAAERRRQHMRNYLDIGSDQTVILYAPTWRDNIRGKNGTYSQPIFLDIDKIRATFGRKIVVLVRAHVNTVGNPVNLRGSAVRDVSAYPDVNDLYLAADILVTDYSSVMFDFVNTLKPVYLLAPDIGDYRDSIRGFYFDPIENGPGLIVSDTDELVKHLTGSPGSIPFSQERYDSFLNCFAPFDDGNAASRVVNVLEKSLFSDL